ncbi:hypothetical protein [Thermodesulfatator autotrophicus]|uniref:Uncharacterized protein n=1 Tax=Thermodesulfatator autotrophicus TaxID=1795632 RepID=A0A177E793_9BACT|nr:hypothetical protein [Thermodesulfatator autotrophicus]OAG27817.1 hypothetical protein TH606_05100 [Thermodesulfatator autotrophicus]
MRYKLFIFLIGLMFLCVSCGGYNVKQTLAPAHPPQGTTHLPKVVILPFADYGSSSVWETWRKNVFIVEALEDELLKAGLATVPVEQVNQYLLNQGVIKPVKTYYPEADSSLLAILEGDWSPEMKAEIWQAIERNQKSQKIKEEKTRPLDTKMIMDLGKTFGARYVVRGRIIDFEARHFRSLNPFKSGLLPFVVNLGSRTVFGVADSETYEALNFAATGGIAGGLIDASWEGAGIGAAAGLATVKSGKTNQAKVQLRIYIQDTSTGEVVWTGRTEVEVTPQSVFANKTSDDLFKKAVEEAVYFLVADFSQALAQGKLIAPTREEISPIVEEAKAAAQEARTAAAEAQEAAKEARKQAVKTERIFEKTLTK